MSARILIVEDELDTQNLIAYLLEQEGYEVLRASTGDEGLRIAQEEHPDLIILDLLLPGKDGFSVCQAIKDNPETASIPIMLLTAVFVEKMDEERAVEAGAEKYLTKADAMLTKPFERGALIEHVKQLLGEELHDDQSKEPILIVARDEKLRAMLERLVKDAGYGITPFLEEGAVAIVVIEEVGDMPTHLPMPWIAFLQNPDDNLTLLNMAFDNGAHDILSPSSLTSTHLRFALRSALERKSLEDTKEQLISQLKRSSLELMQRLENLQQTQHRLIEAERVATLMEMAVAINHEVNNPLSIIEGEAQLLKLQLPNAPATVKRSISRILEAAQRIERLTRRLENLTHPVAVEYIPGVKMIDIWASESKEDEKD